MGHARNSAGSGLSLPKAHLELLEVEEKIGQHWSIGGTQNLTNKRRVVADSEVVDGDDADDNHGDDDATAAAKKTDAHRRRKKEGGSIKMLA